MSLIYAPWTDEQVEALNRWQQCNHVHPFTCGNRGDSGHKEYAAEHNQPDHGILEASTNGWWCPVCGYRQNWAHEDMLTLPENILDRMKRKE